MLTLYAIKTEIAELLAMIESGEEAVDTETGEILTTEQLKERLDALQIAEGEKLENCLKAYKNYMAEGNAHAAEEKAQAEMRRKAFAAAERLKGYIAVCCKGKKVKSTVANLSWRKSKSVEIDEGIALPLEYLLPQKAAEPDKKKIKDALKAGTLIDGCRLVEKDNLTIK